MCMVHAVKLIDSVYKTGKNSYLQTYLKESKYRLKEEAINTFITEDLTDSYTDSDLDSDSKKENDYENNNG